MAYASPRMPGFSTSSNFISFYIISNGLDLHNTRVAFIHRALIHLESIRTRSMPVFLSNIRHAPIVSLSLTPRPADKLLLQCIKLLGVGAYDL